MTAPSARTARLVSLPSCPSGTCVITARVELRASADKEATCSSRWEGGREGSTGPAGPVEAGLSAGHSCTGTAGTKGQEEETPCDSFCILRGKNKFSFQQVKTKQGKRDSGRRTTAHLTVCRGLRGLPGAPEGHPDHCKATERGPSASAELSEELRDLPGNPRCGGLTSPQPSWGAKPEPHRLPEGV